MNRHAADVDDRRGHAPLMFPTRVGMNRIGIASCPYEVCFPTRVGMNRKAAVGWVSGRDQMFPTRVGMNRLLGHAHRRRWPMFPTRVGMNRWYPHTGLVSRIVLCSPREWG